MVKYKLIYFNLKGRGEAARLMFHDSGTEFEDFRIEFSDWAKYKPTMTFGTIPVLEVDGKQLHQSIAIYHYLGKQFGYTAKNDWDSARCEMLVHGMADVYPQITHCLMEKDEAKRKQAWDKLVNEKLKSFFALYSKLMAEKGTTYFVGNEITWADFFLYCPLSLLQLADKSVLAPHPNLVKFCESVESRPRIKEYLSKRSKALL